LPCPLAYDAPLIDAENLFRQPGPPLYTPFKYNPNVLLWSFALEYTLLTTTYYGKEKRYPQGWVPVLEFAFQTPLDGPNAGLTTGTVNPGLIWVNRYLQFAAGAVFPVNARSGRDVCARAQIHFYLSEIFPDTLGKPIFGN
jgi:hypothetical protein